MTDSTESPLDASGTFDKARVARRRVGFIDFTVLPLTCAIDLVALLGSSPQPAGTAIHFANAYNVALADTDKSYRALMASGDVVFSDGTPVVWAGRRLHPDITERWTRVYGPDVMTGVLDRGERAPAGSKQPRHYLLGGTPDVLAQLEQRIHERWSAALVVGSDSPPFATPTRDDLAARDERIRASGATLVWVGLGTPKQDFEVRRLADALPVTALAVGAAFDFLAGTTRQAPRWMQRSGLEWSYRLAQEPRRLARRYLWGNPRFVISVVRQRLGRP
jgi:N-acetylglucosaminyldiphosphoundecaprenol N-acetyl-beta-D-mannosaminyltransferase